MKPSTTEIIISIILRIFILYLVLAIMYNLNAKADQLIKIGIIDTGYDAEYAKSIKAEPLKLCAIGHYDFFSGKSKIGHIPSYALSGRGNHGTLVASIIAEKLKDVNYCAVVIQMYTLCKPGDCEAIYYKNLPKMFGMLKKQNVMAINLSWSGPEPISVELTALKDLTKRGISIFAAAGNRNMNLDKNCMFYPACYFLDNEYIIGALNSTEKCFIGASNCTKCPDSNFGTTVEYFQGKLPKKFEMEDRCATSYATPNALADFVLSFSQLLRGDYRQVPTPLITQQ